MRRRWIIGSLLSLGLLLVGWGLWEAPTGRVLAQVAQIIAGGATGKSRTWPVPAYLKFQHFTSTTTFTAITNSATVLGCVVINTAGAASSTITLYNSTSVLASAAIAIIDATKVGSVFCYGSIVSGQLGIAIASGGTAPDVTVTWQGGL